MKTIASSMEKYEISEHGLPESLTGETIDKQIEFIMSNGKAKPGRILVVTVEIYEQENED